MKGRFIRFQQLSLFDRLFPRKKKRRAPSQRGKRTYTNEPFLKELWDEIRTEYFPDRADLDDYVIYWSNRNQTRTLASCYTEERRVIVAKELNHPKFHPWLHPLLYHEMCHAYLGNDVPTVNGKKAWHGRTFKALEHRHPQMRAFNIWVKSGGWTSAVRSERARAAHARRKAYANN